MGKTSDASEILHRRYFEGKPEMMAMFAEEKAKDLADRIRRARIRRVVEFARGGGAKSAKGKAGKSSKKAKGAATAGKGGACCKGEGGKFAPGNNYGALAGKASSQRSAANRVKERLAAKSKVAKAEKAVAAASGGPKAGIAGMVARSKSASATAGRVQAAREKAALEKRQAKNAKVRAKRAEKKAAGQKAATAEAKVSASRGRISDPAERKAYAAKLAGHRGLIAGRELTAAQAVRIEDAARKVGSARASQIGSHANEIAWASQNRRASRAEKKAEKQAAAKPARDRAIGSMVAKSKGASDKAGAENAARKQAADSLAAQKQRATTDGRKAAINRMVDKSKLASEVKKSEVRLRGWKAKKAAAEAAAPKVATVTPAKAPAPAAAKPVQAAPKSKAKANSGEPKLTASQRRKVEEQRAIAEKVARAEVEARDFIAQNRSPEARTARILEKARTRLVDARRGINVSTANPDRQVRDIKRARAVIAKVDKNQQAKLAEQKARAERRRAQQPRLDLTRGDRASAMNRIVAKSKAASEAKSASPKAPVTASNIASRIAAAKAAEKAQVQASVATKKTDPATAERDRAALKAVQAENAAKRAAKPVERDKPGEADARWRTSGIQPHRIGARVHKAGGVERAAAKIDAKHARTSAMKRMVAKSGEATGKGVAVKSARMAEHQALAAKHGDRLDSMSVEQIRKAQVATLGKQVGTTKPEMIAAMRAKVQADKAQPARDKAIGRMVAKSRLTTRTARMEASLRPKAIPRDAPVEVGKPVTYNGRKQITVTRGSAELTIEQVFKGENRYRVTSSYYDGTTTGKVSQNLGDFDSLAAAKSHAKTQIATIGAVEPGGKPLPYKAEKRARA